MSLMRRITSLLLAAVLLCGMIGIFVPEASAVEFDTSDACIELLKKEEGFCKYPVWDYAQYTIGYGTRCPDDMRSYYSENGITEEEAEQLLRLYLDAFEAEINVKLIQKYDLNLTQNQFDALLSFSYNCGTSWIYDANGTFFKAIVNGATGNDLIRAFALWCSAGGEVKTFLLRRRLSEANMYINGVYEQDPPENYCYVLYNANGGTTSPRSQGYSAEWAVAPYPVPTYAGYVFTGWYTQAAGGTKVTSLTTAHNGMTLYAHWADESEAGTEPENEPVTVTVTATSVNVRKGPGTNYAVVTSLAKGEQVTVTSTVDAGGYLWGEYEKGWLSLQYTNYDALIHEGSTETTEPTEPETETTEPTTPSTEPTTTPSEPETEPTVPETTAPESGDNTGTQSVTGTVNVSDILRVRSGAGTGYAVVDYLKNKDKVTILEQKVVGSTTWGKISSGWISMDYVVLDKTQETESGSSDSTAAETKTGTVSSTTDLRVRSGPGTTYSIAGYLSSGAKVTVTETRQVGSTTWGKVSSGWVCMDYIKLDTTGTATGGTTTGTATGGTTGSATVKGTVKVSGPLRIRSGPGTSYAVAGYLSNGDSVEITEQKTVGATTWGKISKGWISLDYVVLESTASGSTDSTGSTTSGTTDSTAVYGTINVSDCLNIRSGAGTGYSVVGTYSAKTRVQILEQKTVGTTTWGKTDKGWISMYYVTLESSSTTTTTTTGTSYTVTASCLNVRSTAGVSGKIVSYLYYGSKVTVTETTVSGGQTWGKIATGWVCMDYLK